MDAVEINSSQAEGTAWTKEYDMWIVCTEKYAMTQ